VVGYTGGKMKIFSKWLENVSNDDTRWSLNKNSLDIYLKEQKVEIPLSPEQIQTIQQLIDSFQRPTYR
jgi:DNA replication protein DnaD